MNHPRFEKARVTVSKKLIVEFKYTEEFNDLTKKIFSLNPRDQPLPLLLPKMEMTHS